MMITNLPRDLMEEIISRVPSKSMRAVQLTCKEWNTLSKNRIALQIGKASAATKKGKSLMIMKVGYNLYLMSVFVNDVDVDPSTEHKGKLTCLNGQVRISRVFHCEGLLLCILEDGNTKVVVWNPYWGQTRWIELRYSLRSYELGEGLFSRNYLSYALGYKDKKSCRSYKLLRFVDVCLLKAENEFFWYEIYDFDSDSWTTLDVTPYWHIMSDLGVSLKGNTYWCATTKKLFNYEHTDHIICFDYTREKFGPLLPLPYGYRKSSVSLSCVGEEKLAALFLHNEKHPYSLEIWITTMIEADNVSWSKFLTVDMASRADIGSFFIDEVKKVAILFEKVLYRYKVKIIGEAGYVREVDVDLKEHTGIICLPNMFSYVPSLVQLKQPKGGQRKNQSNSEKLRYDQYMLRLSFFKSNCKKLHVEMRCKVARYLYFYDQIRNAVGI